MNHETDNNKSENRDFFREIIDFIIEEKPSGSVIDAKKRELSAKHYLKKVPSDIEIMTRASTSELKEIRNFLKTKPIRTGSGVSVVAIMTKPMRCPHGKCTYCPGGPGSYFGDVPQSYTGLEPATMRGKRVNYDIYAQVFNRLEQYVIAGHNPEKVEIIIMGGTFPSYPRKYQDEVIKDVFKALNDFSRLFYKSKDFLFSKFKEFFELPGSLDDKKRFTKVLNKILTLKKEGSKSINELQNENETAVLRCVGLTIETRPTHALREHGLSMLEQGCTRVELGIQTLYDEVLEIVHRDHSVEDSIRAIRDLKDLGFKINAHIMIGLPLMTPEKDISAIKRLFSDPDFRPDMLKIYPCMVLPGTKLYYDYKEGKYSPYNTETASEVIAESMRHVPAWCRIMRIQRDIPTTITESGVKKSNLRQLIEKKMSEKQIMPKEIRSREIRDRPINNYKIRVTKYTAGRGEEFFIEVVETDHNLIIGFCRLRFPGRKIHPAITEKTAIIRELHVYGSSESIISKSKSVQHKGFGRMLVQKAEEIAKTEGKNRIIVISGVGVREYYKKLGYKRSGPYMGKEL